MKIRRGRNATLTRVLRVWQTLERRRYISAVDLTALAVQHGVAQRTIRRDLHALETAGWLLPKWRHNERLLGD